MQAEKELLFPVIKQGEHVFLAGMTQSGKTTLARHLLAQRPYVIVIDAKHQLQWTGFVVTDSISRVFAEPRTIFRPHSGAEGLVQVQQILKQAYLEEGWHCYVDELYSLGMGNVTRFPPALNELYTRGASRHLTVWASVQRPKFITKFAMTEAVHFFIFTLGSNEDRKDLVNMAGIDQLGSDVQRHQFLYYNRNTRTSVVAELDTKLQQIVKVRDGNTGERTLRQLDRKRQQPRSFRRAETGESASVGTGQI